MNVYFSVLAATRVAYSISTSIADCDETFNYWEPAHMLMTGTGLQTWEYSPDYGLRSWLYIWIVSWPGMLMSSLGVSDKVSIFMGIKTMLAVLSAYIDSKYITAIGKRFNSTVANYTAVVLLLSTGCLSASGAFLPSSFSLLCLTVAFSNQLGFDGTKSNILYLYAVASVIIGCTVGWPFIGLVALPVALHTIVEYGLLRPLSVVVIALPAAAIAVYAVDTHYYGRPLFSTWELVKYNVLGCLPRKDYELAVSSSQFTDNLLFKLGCIPDDSGSRGSHLYGLEPWTFFFKNLFLNFNIAFILALCAPILILIAGGFGKLFKALWYISPFYVWFGFWLLVPHKEERFMVPIYSVLCLSAGLALESLDSFLKKIIGKIGGVLSSILVMIFCVLSMLRSAAMIRYYSAPLGIAVTISEIQSGSTICFGTEWYRFMSNYFTPLNSNIRFIDHGFNGMLPKPFTSTSTAPPNMNDVNQKDPGQYSPLKVCTHVVISSFKSSKPLPIGDDWDTVVEYPLLDASSTPLLARMFDLSSLPKHSSIPQPVYGAMKLLKKSKKN